MKVFVFMRFTSADGLTLIQEIPEESLAVLHSAPPKMLRVLKTGVTGETRTREYRYMGKQTEINESPIYQKVILEYHEV